MFYRFASVTVRLLLRLFTRCRVEGLENVPGDRSFLLVSNHLHLIDPPLLGAVLPRRIVFMAKDELFRNPVLGPIVRWYGAFAVRRGQPDRQALKHAATVLARGGVVGMFPEGTRSKTGELHRAFSGAALVAVLSKATVLPVAIIGTDRVNSPLSLLARPTITVRVGQPFTLARDRGEKEDLERLTGLMMGRVASLLPEERRGYYASTLGELSPSPSP